MSECQHTFNTAGYCVVCKKSRLLIESEKMRELLQEIARDWRCNCLSPGLLKRVEEAINGRTN